MPGPLVPTFKVFLKKKYYLRVLKQYFPNFKILAKNNDGANFLLLRTGKPAVVLNFVVDIFVCHGCKGP